MADDFEYVSKTRLLYKDGARHAYLTCPSPSSTACRARCASITGYPKARPWPPRSTTSWPEWPAECSAPCAAPWQGARYPHNTCDDRRRNKRRPGGFRPVDAAAARIACMRFGTGCRWCLDSEMVRRDT